MPYFRSDTITRSRGNIAEPATTVAGAMPLTRTCGPSPTASSRIRWLIAALDTSYGSLPCLGTTALAELVSTMLAGQRLRLEYPVRLLGEYVVAGDVDGQRAAPYGLGGLRAVRRRIDRGRIDQDVQAAESQRHGLDRPAERVARGQVDLDGHDHLWR